MVWINVIIHDLRDIMIQDLRDITIRWQIIHDQILHRPRRNTQLSAPAARLSHAYYRPRWWVITGACTPKRTGLTSPSGESSSDASRVSEAYVAVQGVSQGWGQWSSGRDLGRCQWWIHTGRRCRSATLQVRIITRKYKFSNTVAVRVVVHTAQHARSMVVGTAIAYEHDFKTKNRSAQCCE